MRKAMSPDVVAQILSLYADKVSVNSISKITGFCNSSVKKRLVRLGCYVPSPVHTGAKLTGDIRLQMEREYVAGAESRELSRKYGIRMASIQRWLATRGSLRSKRQRVHSVDDNAFSVPSDERDYWVGMLMTDGHVHHPAVGDPIIGIGLQERDAEHVKKLRAFLGSNKPIYVVEPRVSALVARVGQKQHRLTIPSAKLASDLAAFGVLPRKTHTAKVVGLESSSAFWRGCIDGDGTILISDDRPVVHLCGASRDLLGQFSAWVSSVVGCDHHPIYAGKGVGTIQVSGIKAIATIRALYPSGCVALERKLEIATSIIRRADADPFWCRGQSRPETRKAKSEFEKAWHRIPENREKHMERCARADKSKLTGRPPTLQGKEADIVSQYESGDDSTIIAKRCGVHPKTITKILHESNVVMRKSGGRPRIGRLPLTTITRVEIVGGTATEHLACGHTFDRPNDGSSRPRRSCPQCPRKQRKE